MHPCFMGTAQDPADHAHHTDHADHADHVDDVLGPAVREGRVAYGELTGREHAIMEPFTRAPGKAGSDERLAFWINAYNAAAIVVALRRSRRSARFRRKGLYSLFERFVFFFVERVPIDGLRRTLAGTEYVTIRRQSRDPRIHFALVCASNGCPPLREGRYHGTDLDAELDLAARAFMQPGAGYVLDRERGILRVSRILKWYRRDMKSLGGAVGCVSRFGDPEDANWLQKEPVRVRYMAYDWGLNTARANAHGPARDAGSEAGRDGHAEHRADAPSGEQAGAPQG